MTRPPPRTLWDHYAFEFTQCVGWLKADNADPELVRRVEDLAEIMRRRAIAKAQQVYRGPPVGTANTGVFCPKFTTIICLQGAFVCMGMFHVSQSLGLDGATGGTHRHIGGSGFVVPA
jgi:hypothetical protein